MTGQTLMASECPERVEIHAVPSCTHCQAPLAALASVGYEERQVFRYSRHPDRSDGTSRRDQGLPGVWQSEQRDLSYVGDSSPCNNGPVVSTWASYFTNQHHVPVERTTEIFADLVSHRVSEATVLKASEQLEPVHCAVYCSGERAVTQC